MVLQACFRNLWFSSDLWLSRFGKRSASMTHFSVSQTLIIIFVLLCNINFVQSTRAKVQDDRRGKDLKIFHRCTDAVQHEGRPLTLLTIELPLRKVIIHSRLASQIFFESPEMVLCYHCFWNLELCLSILLPKFRFVLGIVFANEMVVVSDKHGKVCSCLQAPSRQQTWPILTLRVGP